MKDLAENPGSVQDTSHLRLVKPNHDTSNCQFAKFNLTGTIFFFMKTAEEATFLTNHLTKETEHKTCLKQ